MILVDGIPAPGPSSFTKRTILVGDAGGFDGIFLQALR